MNALHIRDKRSDDSLIRIYYEGDCTSMKIIANLIGLFSNQIKDGEPRSVYIHVWKDSEMNPIREVSIRNDPNDIRTAVVTDRGFCHDLSIRKAACTKETIGTRHGCKHVYEIELHVS